MNSAEDWYKEFVKAFAKDENIRFLYKKMQNKEIGLKDWSKLIFNLLEKLGNDNEYEVKKEKQRVDMKWYKNDQAIVAIEHENIFNKIDDLQDEIDNLLSVNSKIKVLITYISNREKFQQISDELKNRILDNLSKTKSFDFELLLILSSMKVAKEAQDQLWVGYLFKPTFKSSLLFYPTHKT